MKKNEKSTTLQEIVGQLKSCGFECEAGSIENSAAFRQLEEMSIKEQEDISDKLFQASCAAMTGLITLYGCQSPEWIAVRSIARAKELIKQLDNQ